MGQPHHLGLDPSVESGVERRDNFRGHLIRRCGKTGPLLSYICLPLFAVTHTASRKSGSSKMLSGKAFLITTLSHASATCDGATAPKCFEAAATSRSCLAASFSASNSIVAFCSERRLRSSATTCACRSFQAAAGVHSRTLRGLSDPPIEVAPDLARPSSEVQATKEALLLLDVPCSSCGLHHRRPLKLRALELSDGATAPCTSTELGAPVSLHESVVLPRRQHHSVGRGAERERAREGGGGA
mmetsp:Transcript_13951/g.42551  ORF Transcript_13951/g.42551 Transcript_13951/m.42551 type:complete len:243 (-) Transcript_13951:14-742(-)